MEWSDIRPGDTWGNWRILARHISRKAVAREIAELLGARVAIDGARTWCVFWELP